MLKDRVAIVTGGAKGIGRYVAHSFAHAGAKIVIADVDDGRLEKTTAELRGLGADVMKQGTDVRDENAVRFLVEQTLSRFDRIDVLVNNAAIVPHFSWGVPRWPRVKDMDKEFWDKVIQTNLGGTFLCTKHVLPHMEKRRSGHIINLHGGGSPANHGSCAYVVSKDAIKTFTRFVAEEAREANVCVVVFAPGSAIATEDAAEEARRRMPGPEVLGDGFVLAAQAGMELSGRRLAYEAGRLSAAD
jgi:NAD(P)-dependent dehydrogenase (short-subunit alcohol dehydrogenase family)